MELEEFKKRLAEIEDKNIITSKHAFKRIQDVKRKITYDKILDLLTSQKGLYRVEEQKAMNDNEIKCKLWFKLNDFYDMNVYTALKKEIKEESLNSLVIISAHKVKRKIQDKLRKNKNEN